MEDFPDVALESGVVLNVVGSPDGAESETAAVAEVPDTLEERLTNDMALANAIATANPDSNFMLIGTPLGLVN